MELNRFIDLRDRLESNSIGTEEIEEGSARLLKWVQNTIQDLQEKTKARKISKEWETTQPALNKKRQPEYYLADSEQGTRSTPQTQPP